VFFKEKTEKAKVQVRSFVSQEKKTFIQVGSQVFLKKKTSKPSSNYQAFLSQRKTRNS
jgi:prefoldin subunit 5